MQYSPVYLYPNKINAYTNALDSWQGGFRKVYQRTLKIYRGVDNKIDLQVRNADQKAIDITNQNIVFNIIARDTQELILKKDCVQSNDSSLSKGKISVNLTELEIADLEPGFYNFTIHSEIRTTIDADEYRVTSKTPFFVDSQYGVVGQLEVRGEIDGLPLESKEYIEFTKHVDFTTQDTWYISSIIDAGRPYTTADSNHTLQFYTTNLTGNIEVEASTETGASPKTWTKILDIEPTTDIFYENIVGKYSYFRIKYYPNTGTVDKILYR